MADFEATIINIVDNICMRTFIGILKFLKTFKGHHKQKVFQIKFCKKHKKQKQIYIYIYVIFN